MPRNVYYEIGVEGKTIHAAPISSYWSTAVIETTRPYHGVMVSLIFDNPKEALTTFEDLQEAFSSNTMCVFIPTPNTRAQITAFRLIKEFEDQLILWVKDNLYLALTPIDS